MPTHPRQIRKLTNQVHRSTARSLSLILAALMLVSCVASFPLSATAKIKAASLTQSKAEKIARSVTIYRDSYGVPHVYGPTDVSCVFGYIYAQAEDNFGPLKFTAKEHLLMTC
jgi:acyl-homoserine lactone acylase PvdQ